MFKLVWNYRRHVSSFNPCGEKTTTGGYTEHTNGIKWISKEPFSNSVQCKLRNNDFTRVYILYPLLDIKRLLTLGTVDSLVSINAVALSKVARAVSRAVVGTGCRDPLSLFHEKTHFVGPEVVIVDGQEPATCVEVLKEGHVDYHWCRGSLRAAHFEVVSLEACPSLPGVRLGCRMREDHRAFQSAENKYRRFEYMEFILNCYKRPYVTDIQLTCGQPFRL